MSLTLIASDKPSLQLPGVHIDQCGVGAWLRSIPAVRSWLSGYEGQTVNVLAGDRWLPNHLAEHSLTVPTSEQVDRRLVDELELERQEHRWTDEET